MTTVFQVPNRLQPQSCGRPVFPHAMKILFNCPLPFALAHGGMQTQIEQTQAALIALGLEVEPLRWWDATQSGDLIHYFGRMPAEHIKLCAAEKN